MKKVFFLVLMPFIALFLLYPQNTEISPAIREVPPAPVVSNLLALGNENTVTLTWEPAPGIEGETLIYRANRPITAANFTSAELIRTLPFTENTFTDTLTDGQDYYYAVLSRDQNGTLYEFFLPVSNSLLVPVSGITNGTSGLESEFSAFDAITRNDAVIITWKASIPKKNLVLYRSTSAFTNMNSLLQAIVVSSFSDTGTPYVDYPVPGVPYYYAILDEDTIRAGKARFIENANTNRIPVEIPASYAHIQRNNLPSLRPMPLPFLNPSQKTAVTGLTLSDETERVIHSLTLLRKPKKESVKSPYIFSSDMNSISGGEEYSLKILLEKSFLNLAWDEAIISLDQFLSIRRTPETTARTHFYLGEAYYFTGNYDKALLEFLLAEDKYYNQSKEWIQLVLVKLVKPSI